MRRIEFKGSSDEAIQMVAAVNHNCECPKDSGGQRFLNACTAHRMLAHDQRAVDGLLVMRHLRVKLEDEEFHPKKR